MNELEQLRAENAKLTAEVAYLRAEVETLYNDLKEVEKEVSNLSWQFENTRDATEYYDRERW